MSQAQVPSSQSKSKLSSTWLDAWMRWATFHSVAYGLIALGLALVLTLVLAWSIPQTFLGFDERSDSLTWNLSSKSTQERRVVMVDIDEKSIQALGPWPWSRETMASLVRGLNNYGVGLKLFDVVLPDAKPGDDALTRALQSGGPSIGGQILSLDPKIDVKSGALPWSLRCGVALFGLDAAWLWVHWELLQYHECLFWCGSLDALDRS